VLVSNLLDYALDAFGLHETHIVTHHPLQAFSPEYFKTEPPKTERQRLFSYSEENMLAARSFLEPKGTTPFFSTELSPPADSFKNINIEQLAAFYLHPARFLLQHRMGLYLEEQLPLLEERENFNLNPLQQYFMGQDLVDKRLAGYDLKDLYPVYRAAGSIPHGTVGEVIYNDLCLDAEEFVTRINEYIKDQPLQPASVDIEISGISLKGKLDHLYPNGQNRIRYAHTKPKDLLAAWIYHLALGAVKETGIPQQTYMVNKDAVWLFSPIENSQIILSNLLEHYKAGLCKPLLFFPESAFEFAKGVLIRNQAEAISIKRARNKWLGTDFSRGESDDMYYQLCFKKKDMIDDAFQAISLEVFQPLFEHGKEIDRFSS
jgi:exodeoxyribonuclease V gamma subunit